MKMNIALKEANETEYWLRLLRETNYLTEKEFESLEPEIKEIIAILVSICKKTNNFAFCTLHFAFIYRGGLRNSQASDIPFPEQSNFSLPCVKGGGKIFDFDGGIVPNAK